MTTSASPERPSVLCVDDEPMVLQGLTLTLRKRFDVVTAGSPNEGLAALRRPAPFGVVVSDMRMPGMDGAVFLARVKELSPDSTRMLLTGHADIEAATRAVNDGQIFRFLTKPCPPDALLRALDDGVRQHQLVTAERELLDRTLRGCVRALTDILSLTNPEAFGRATRIKNLVVEACAEMGIADVWAIEVAAMVSQLGLIILPAEVAERARKAEQAGDERGLEENDRSMIERVPVVTRQILANIPRLEPVLEILDLAARTMAKAASAPEPLYPLARAGAEALRVAMDYDSLDDGKMTRAMIVAALRGRAGRYDVGVLDALLPAIRGPGGDPDIRSLTVGELRPGMVLVADVKTSGGTLLIARGHELTPGSLERLRNFARTVGISVPVLVSERAPS